MTTPSFPNSNTPMVDTRSGVLTPVWRQFLVNLAAAWNSGGNANDLMVNPGTGSNFRTLANVLADYANVNDYLNAGDGNYDGAFIRALADKGHVYVPRTPALGGDRYRTTTTITLADGQALRGDGEGSTIIECQSAAVPVVTLADRVWNFSLKDVTLRHAVLTATGTTHSNKTIDGFSIDLVAAGWRAGMAVSGSGIPATAVIASLTTSSVTLSVAATTSVTGTISVAKALAGGDGLYQGRGQSSWVNDGRLENVVATGNAIGFNLGVAFYCDVLNCQALSNTSYGWSFTHHGTMLAGDGVTQVGGVLQWYLVGCASDSNGNTAYNYCSTATGSYTGGPIVSVGALTDCTTFANGGHGVAFLGNTYAQMNSLRVEGGFYGNDACHEIYLDSYGANHLIRPTMLELAGQFSGRTIQPLVGSTHSNTTVDGLAVNPLLYGVQIGMLVTGTGIAAGTTVAGLSATTITLSQAATATAAGVTLTFAASPVACGINASANNNGIYIAPGVVNGANADGLFSQSPNTMVVGGLWTNNGLSGTSGRQNGLYFFGVAGQVTGAAARDTGASVQKYGVASNVAGNQLTGCNLVGNLTGPTALPTFFGDTTTSIVGCMPLNINQVWADQLHVYGAAAFTGSGGTAGTSGVNVVLGGLAVIGGGVFDNLSYSSSLYATTATGGPLGSGKANFHTGAYVDGVQLTAGYTSGDLKVTGNLWVTGAAGVNIDPTATGMTAGQFRAVGSAAFNAGVTITASGLTTTAGVVGNGITTDNITVNKSVGIGVAASGVTGAFRATGDARIDTSLGVGMAPSGVAGRIWGAENLVIGGTFGGVTSISMNGSLTGATSGSFSGNVQINSLGVGLAATGSAGQLRANGAVSFSAGVTVSASGLAVTGGITVDNIAMSGALYNPGATGGYLGAGTINVSSGLYVNSAPH